MLEEATWYRGTQSLTEADDPAAALAWRIAGATPPSHRDAPLPWLPDVPPALRQDAETSDYLDRLTHRIDDLKQRLADEAQQSSSSDQAPWQRTLPPDVDGQLISDLAVWRAAHDIPPTEPNPTGPPVKEPQAARHQSRLIRRLANSSPVPPTPRADAASGRLQAGHRRAEHHAPHEGGAPREAYGPLW